VVLKFTKRLLSMFAKIRVFQELSFVVVILTAKSIRRAFGEMEDLFIDIKRVAKN